MNTKRKYWSIILVLLFPYILFSLRLLDILLELLLNEKYITFFSYPFIILLQPINYLLGNPEGLGFILIIGNIVYPVYSLFVLCISILLAWKLYRLKRKGYITLVIATIMLILSPFLVSLIDSSLASARHEDENQRLLESHSGLTISTLKADFTPDEIIVPIEIRGLNPENKSYLIETQLSDKDNYLGSVSLDAHYVNNTWEYSTIESDTIMQNNNTVLVEFSADSNTYNRENLEMLIRIHRDFNMFYSEWFDVKTM